MVSVGAASNLIVHDILGDPPRPYIKTLEGDLKIPRSDELERYTRSQDFV